MRLPSLLIALLIGLSTAAVAEKRSSIPKGTPYSEARKQLIAEGYTPWFFPNGQDCSIGREEICKQYEETVSCSGSGLALCTFFFMKGVTGPGLKGLTGRETGITVTTYGEDNIKVQSIRPMTKGEKHAATAD